MRRESSLLGIDRVGMVSSRGLVFFGSSFCRALMDEIGEVQGEVSVWFPSEDDVDRPDADRSLGPPSGEAVSMPLSLCSCVGNEGVVAFFCAGTVVRCMTMVEATSNGQGWGFSESLSS